MHSTTVVKAGPESGVAQDSIRNMHEQLTLFAMLSSLAVGAKVWNQQYYMKVQMTEEKRQGTNEQPAFMVLKSQGKHLQLLQVLTMLDKVQQADKECKRGPDKHQRAADAHKVC